MSEILCLGTSSATVIKGKIKYFLIQWFIQVYALLWKELLLKYRRLSVSIIETLIPPLVIAVLWYGATLTPLVSVPGYEYSDSDIGIFSMRSLFNANATNGNVDGSSVIPMFTPPNNHAGAGFQAPSWIKTENATSVMMALTSMDRMYDTFTTSEYFTSQFRTLLTSQTAASLTSQLATFVFSNHFAANPFFIPNFDGYVKLLRRVSVLVGRGGIKSTQHINGFVWNVLHQGYITFSPNSPEVDELVNYLRTVSKTFEKKLFTPFGPGDSDAQPMVRNSGYGFGSFEESNETLLSSGYTQWAHIHIKTLTSSLGSGYNDSEIGAGISGHKERDTRGIANANVVISMNETLVPNPEVLHESFPSGLGTDYAKYIYSGFATLQQEINNFISYKSMKISRIQKLIDIGDDDVPFLPFVQSTCNHVLKAPLQGHMKRKIDVSSPLFRDPKDGTAQSALKHDLLKISAKSVVETEMIPIQKYGTSGPCLFEVKRYCSEVFEAVTREFHTDIHLNKEKTEKVTKCIVDFVLFNRTKGKYRTGASPLFISPGCKAAVKFIETDKKETISCSKHVLDTCQNMTKFSFLTGIGRRSELYSNDMRSCALEGLPSICFKTDFIGYLSTIMSDILEPCASELKRFCPNSGKGATGILCLQFIDKHQIISPMCMSIIEGAPKKCQDDFDTICPFNMADITKIPLLCLHSKRELLSSTCLETNMMKIVEKYAANDARVTVTNGQAHLCHLSNNANSNFGRGISAVAFPAKMYERNQFFLNCGPLIGLIVTLAFTYPFTSHVRHIVLEREKGQRDYFFVIGVHHSSLLTAHTIIGFLKMFLTSVLSSTVLSSLLVNIPILIIFRILFTYAGSLLGLASLLASCCSSSRIASAIAPVLLFLMSLPSFGTDVYGENSGLFASLSAPSLVSTTIDLLVAKSGSASSNTDFFSHVSRNCNIMLCLGVLYITLALFVEYYRTASTSIGIIGNCTRRLKKFVAGGSRRLSATIKRNKIYARLQQSDYTGHRLAVVESSGVIEIRHGYDDEEEEEELSIQNRNGINDYSPTANLTESLTVPGRSETSVETENTCIGGVSTTPIKRRMNGVSSPEGARGNNNNLGDIDEMGMTIGTDHTNQRSSMYLHTSRHPMASNLYTTPFVEMNNISYTASGLNGTRSMVRNITASFYRNQINVILGPLSSGKSTLGRLITGLVTPTEGSCLVEERSLTEVDHTMMGVCMQQDIFWDYMTVAEHIKFIQMLRGTMDKRERAKECTTLCEALHIGENKDVCWVNKLPNGLKRRMSVAMAFAGGSNYIILDEPLASVDPFGRGCIWRLLEQNARERCIVVLTSNVEEAELADHVVLLHRGSVKSSGSPQFIKEDLGGGGMIVSICRGAHCKSASVVEMVMQYCSHSQLINNVGQELCFRLDPSDSENFPLLLSGLETAAAENDISTISISDSRFDEVFMRVVREFDAQGEVVYGSDGNTTPINCGIAPGVTSENDINGTSVSNSEEHRAHLVSESPRTKEEGPRDMNYKIWSSRRANGSEPIMTSDIENEEAQKSKVDDRKMLYEVGKLIGAPREVEGRMRRGSLDMIWRNILSTITKHVAGSSANFLTVILQFLLPLFCVVIGVQFNTSRISTIGEAVLPAVTLVPSLYGSSESFLYSPPMSSDGSYPKINLPILNSPSLIYGNTTILSDIKESLDVATYINHHNMRKWDGNSMKPYRKDYIALDAERRKSSLLVISPNQRFQALSNTSLFPSPPETISNLLSNDSSKRYQKGRHGAFAFGSIFGILSNVISPLDAPPLLLADKPHNTSNLNYSWITDFLFHNSSSPHAIPIYLSVMQSIRLMRDANFSSASLIYESKPFYGGNGAYVSEPSHLVSELVSSLLILAPFAFITTVAVRSVLGKENGLYCVSTASNLTPVSYWIGTFVWSTMHVMLFSVASLSLLVFNDAPLVSTTMDIGLALVIFFFYSTSSIALSYLISRMFTRPTTGHIVIALFHFTTGFSLVVASFAVELLPDNSSTIGAKSENRRFVNIFRCIPSFVLGDYFVRRATIQRYEFFGLPKGNNEFGDNFVAYSIGILILTACVYFGLVIILDSYRNIGQNRIMRGIYSAIRRLRNSICGVNKALWDEEREQKVCSSQPMESYKENASDISGGGQSTIVRPGPEALTLVPPSDGFAVVNCWVRYSGDRLQYDYYAVKDVSVGVMAGDRLAILGENGAGKTSLLRVLSGIIKPSFGHLYYKGVEVSSPFGATGQLGVARSITGYSPECGGSDGTIEEMGAAITPYILLHLMADYRGLKRSMAREGHVFQLLHALGLHSVCGTRCQSLSVGMKKRLSVGVALVGYPSYIFLDEPTAGLDPVGCRQVWAALARVPDSCAIAMTTQSTIDVEMFANRVLYLKSGRTYFMGESAKTQGQSHTILLTIFLKENTTSTSTFHCGSSRPYLGGGPRNICDSLADSIGDNYGNNVPCHTNSFDDDGASTASMFKSIGKEEHKIRDEVMLFVLNTFPGAELLGDMDRNTLKFKLLKHSDTLSIEQTKGGFMEAHRKKKISGAQGENQSDRREPLNTRLSQGGTLGKVSNGTDYTEECPHNTEECPHTNDNPQISNVLVTPTCNTLDDTAEISLREVFEKLHNKRKDMLRRSQGRFGRESNQTNSPVSFGRSNILSTNGCDVPSHTRTAEEHYPFDIHITRASFSQALSEALGPLNSRPYNNLQNMCCRVDVRETMPSY